MSKAVEYDLRQLVIVNQLKAREQAELARKWLLVAIAWPDREEAKKCRRNRSFLSNTFFSIFRSGNY